jgi:DNA-binding MarR family transcriptional regulator
MSGPSNSNGYEPNSDGVRQLAARARALAEELIGAADQLAGHLLASRNMQVIPSALCTDLHVVTQVEHYLRARRRRESLFPTDLFADPAWDILLELFVAEKKGVGVSISSACIASAVPPTTALRWIARLEELGLVIRRADARDARRSWLRLSRDASATVTQWTRATFGE